MKRPQTAGRGQRCVANSRGLSAKLQVRFATQWPVFRQLILRCSTGTIIIRVF